jgi:hypothetical protein
MCIKGNPNLLLVKIPLKNLIMVRMNLEDKEPTKMSWFFKEVEAKERGGDNICSTSIFLCLP